MARFALSRGFCVALTGAVTLGLMALSPVAEAQWHASVGAQSANQARQALAFLPNEIWIHEGDSITFTVETGEIHTVTFLKAGQVRPPFPVGCPGFTIGSGSFDGSTCLTTPPLVKGATFKVTFPAVGNFKLVCLVHSDMTGVVHVLESSSSLPHNQKFYDQEAVAQRNALLTDVDRGDHHGDQDDQDDAWGWNHVSHVVIAGTGETTATPGGHDGLSLMRFEEPVIEIHAGDTVIWDNHDPETPHTITFGTEPANLQVPSGGAFKIDADGALHAVVNSPTDNVHSGFIVAAPQERTGLPQSPLGHTRFEVTFPNPGVYPYICALHDNLGMVGRVIVQP